MRRCNGIKECRNGEDEEHCNTNPCNIKREFYCVMDHLCIPLEWVCDKEKDCTDGADEKKSACLVKPLIRNNSSEKYQSNLSMCMYFCILYSILFRMTSVVIMVQKLEKKRIFILLCKLHL